MDTVQEVVQSWHLHFLMHRWHRAAPGLLPPTSDGSFLPTTCMHIEACVAHQFDTVLCDEAQSSAHEVKGDGFVCKYHRHFAGDRNDRGFSEASFWVRSRVQPWLPGPRDIDRDGHNRQAPSVKQLSRFELSQGPVLTKVQSTLV